jgi:hypothetical protein
VTANTFLIHKMAEDLTIKMSLMGFSIRAAAREIGTTPTRLHGLLHRRRAPQLGELLDVCDWLCQPVGAYFADEEAATISPTGDPSAGDPDDIDPFSVDPFTDEPECPFITSFDE